MTIETNGFKWGWGLALFLGCFCRDSHASSRTQVSVYSQHFHLQVAKLIGRSSDPTEESRRIKEFTTLWQSEFAKMAPLLETAVKNRSLSLNPVTAKGSSEPFVDYERSSIRMTESTSPAQFNVSTDPQKAVVSVEVPSVFGPQQVRVGFWLKPRARWNDWLRTQEILRSEIQKFRRP